MQTILTSKTHTIYSLDSDLSYSKLLALWNLSNPSYWFIFGKKIIHQQAFTVHVVILVILCRRNTLDVLIMLLVMVCCSGIKMYMKCVA